MAATPVAVAAVGGASSASAAIVYFDVTDTVVGTASGVNFGNINLSGAGSYDLTTTTPSFGVDFASAQAEKPRLFTNSNVQTSHDSSIFGMGLTRFSEDASIGSATGTWSTGSAYLDSPFTTPGAWPGTPDGYAGLRLGAGPDYNYGWARLIYDDTANTLTITGFAFESVVNTSITAGDVGTAIPEPASSALMLAAGAAGAAAYRRRRSEKALAA